MNTNRSFLAALAIATLAGCAGEKAAVPPERYEITGEIVRLPAAGERQIVLKHEAIPGFRDESGKVGGMEAMTMPFALADGVSTEGLVPGDAVAFTLEVNWSSDKEPVRIVRLARSALIRKLDLESGELPAAQPDGTQPAAGETPR